MAKHRFSLEEVKEAMESMQGFCVACGESSDDGIEPDARECKCESCGEFKVFGAEEVLLMGLVD